MYPCFNIWTKYSLLTWHSTLSANYVVHMGILACWMSQSSSWLVLLCCYCFMHGSTVSNYIKLRCRNLWINTSTKLNFTYWEIKNLSLELPPHHYMAPLSVCSLFKVESIGRVSWVSAFVFFCDLSFLLMKTWRPAPSWEHCMTLTTCQWPSKFNRWVG